MLRKNQQIPETQLARVSKTYKNHRHAWGRFWIAKENFEEHFTLLCHILQFVANYSFLTVHKNQQARLYCCLETKD